MVAGCIRQGTRTWQYIRTSVTPLWTQLNQSCVRCIISRDTLNKLERSFARLQIIQYKNCLLTTVEKRPLVQVNLGSSEIEIHSPAFWMIDPEHLGSSPFHHNGAQLPCAHFPNQHVLLRPIPAAFYPRDNFVASHRLGDQRSTKCLTPPEPMPNLADHNRSCGQGVECKCRLYPDCHRH